MPLTKEFYRFAEAGWCNAIASSEASLVWVAPDVYAVAAAEQVLLWNVKTGQRIGHCAGSSAVRVLEASSARGLLAVGYADGSVKLFSLASASPEPVVVFTGHKSAVSSLAFSADGLVLASGGRDSGLILWDVVAEAGLVKLNGHKGVVTRVRFSHDSRFLISAAKDSFIKFWDLASNHCFYTLADHRSEIWDFTLSEEDTRLVTGSMEQELRIYQLRWKDQNKDDGEDPAAEIEASLKRLRTDEDPDASMNANEQGTDIVNVRRVGMTLRKAKGRVTQLLLSPDQQLLLALGTGNLCDVYRLYSAEESRKRIQKKIRKRKKQTGMEGVRVEELVTEISRDLSTQIVRIGDFYPPSKGSKLKRIAFNHPKASREGYKVCTVLSSNEIGEQRLELTSEKVVTAEVVAGRGVHQPGHRGEIRAIDFSADDQALLSAAADSVKVWSRSSLAPLRTLESPGAAPAIAAVFLPGDRHAAVGRKDGALELWDVAAAEIVQSIPDAHGGTIWAIRVTADQKRLVTAGADKAVRFWTFVMAPSQSDKKKKTISLVPSGVLEMSEEILCLQLSANGKFLAVGLLDNTARVHFMDTLKFFLSLYGHSLPVLCLDLSADSRLVVTGAADKNVKIWGLDFGDCHKSLFAHDDAVTGVQFLGNSHMFFSIGKDGAVKQWDADKFTRIQVLTGHQGEIWALGISGKGQWVATASHDRTIRVWEETDEILVLGEEAEDERSAEAEKELLDAADVIPGEVAGETSLAARRTVDTVKAAENIMEALAIRREQKGGLLEDSNHPPHPMMVALKATNPDHFVLDVIRRIRSSELEKSLLLVPFGECVDLLGALQSCVEGGHQSELSARVLFFILRIHQNQLVASASAASVVERLRASVPPSLRETRDRVGFNLAALRLLQAAVEEREEVRLFSDATQKHKEKRKKKAAKEAYIMTVT